jgi:hypothetical protein
VVFETQLENISFLSEVYLGFLRHLLHQINILRAPLRVVQREYFFKCSLLHFRPCTSNLICSFLCKSRGEVTPQQHKFIVGASVFLKQQELFPTLYNSLLILEITFYFADTNLDDTFSAMSLSLINKTETKRYSAIYISNTEILRFLILCRHNH